MSDQFWEHIDTVLRAAASTSTVDQLVLALKIGPDQDSRDLGAAAFFAGSGGEKQLADALDGSRWDVSFVEGDYHWKAVSKTDGSVIEYIEGDVYRRTP